MSVFITWSGENSPSHELAKALDTWIPSVIQHVDCYLSSTDTVPGRLWIESLMEQLSSKNVGIACMYSGNLDNRWIHFESGAIAAKTGKGRLCPLLIDVEKKTELPSPLGMFQVKTLQKDEMLSVMQMINADGSDKPLPPEKLKESFEQWWEKLESKIESIKAMKPSQVEERPEREILEEILNTVRSLARFQVSPESANMPNTARALARLPLASELAAEIVSQAFRPQFPSYFTHWLTFEGTVTSIKPIDSDNDEIRVDYLSPPGFEGGVTLLGKMADSTRPPPRPHSYSVEKFILVNRPKPHGLKEQDKVELLT